MNIYIYEYIYIYIYIYIFISVYAITPNRRCVITSCAIVMR